MAQDKEICYTRGCFIHPEESTQTKHCDGTGCNKMDVFDWLADITPPEDAYDIVEVRFKNTRKAFYRNLNKLRLCKGEVVAVEANPGHDIGIVSLVGELVKEQIKKNDRKPTDEELKKIYRKAKEADVDKWREAIALEQPTMIKARQIAEGLKLDMKIGDVEYQGDKTKAIFYYYAEDRVDFRELIKVLAEEFKVKIEMKQIGARQEAGRIGGLGTCGRELCCSTWMSNFVSVTTNSARYQEISLNPQKLAGQCSKLKCCLNYELKTYLALHEEFPDVKLALQTVKGPLYYQKSDIFKKILWYSQDNPSRKEDDLVLENTSNNLIPIPLARVKEIVELNKKGIKVSQINEPVKETRHPLDYQNAVGQESVTRFEEKSKRRRKKRRN
jgi:cell fate regulator YaaT (PSP1 superfamily)